MPKAKRLRIKRLNPRVPTGRSQTGVDMIDNSRYELIDDVPLFANDGWFLLLDGDRERSWYQIQGKAYVPRDGDTGMSQSRIQSELAQHFRWVLHRCDEQESEIGKEATAAFSKMLWRMRRVPREIWQFMHAQQNIQYSRDQHRKMAQRMRSFRDRKAG